MVVENVLRVDQTLPSYQCRTAVVLISYWQSWTDKDRELRPRPDGFATIMSDRGGLLWLGTSAKIDRHSVTWALGDSKVIWYPNWYKIYPILCLWVCPPDNSPLIEVRISKFEPKMHLSTVKILIDLGRFSFILNFKPFVFRKVSVSYSFASFYLYLVRPSPQSVTHPKWLHTHTDSYSCGQGPAMGRETVYLYCPACGAFDLGLAVSVPLPIVTGIFVLLWFQSG